MTINACKDLLKSFFRSRTVSLDEIAEQSSEMPTDDREVLEAVLSLPPKYKDVVYLHYYEGYTARRSADFGKKCEHDLHTYKPFQAAASGQAGR